jgi:Na+/H+-dicarboxylate symporter
VEHGAAPKSDGGYREGATAKEADEQRTLRENVALVRRFFEGFFAVMMRLTLAVVALAPIGVFGFMLSASAGHGLAAFEALGLYALTVFAGLLLHAGVTLPTIVWVLAKRSPLQHAKTMTPALLTAFSTASSNGTLPLTMKCVEESGVPNEVSSFVLPLGATINMDGTALYEAVAVLFIAQVYGMDLSLGQQAVVALTALLASVGAAGIPHAGTVMMVVVLSAVGLPTTAVGLILAVDRVLDMCRTTVNVWSDSVAAVVVAKMAGLSSDAAKSST